MRIGVLARSQQPVRSGEQVRPRRRHAGALASRHGVSTDELRRLGEQGSRGGKDGALRRGHVGHDSIESGRAKRREPPHGEARRSRNDDDVSPARSEPFQGSSTIGQRHLVDDPVLKSPRQGLGVGIDAEHDRRVSQFLERPGEGAADQTHADHGDALHASVTHHSTSSPIVKARHCLSAILASAPSNAAIGRRGIRPGTRRRLAMPARSRSRARSLRTRAAL